jgi:hypothetical protein
MAGKLGGDSEATLARLDNEIQKSILYRKTIELPKSLKWDKYFP